MASFTYKAKTSAGLIVKGRFDAADKNMVASLLRSKGLYPLDIKEIKLMQKDIGLRFGKKINARHLAVFCRQFYTMLNAGVPVIRCLDLLRKQTENVRLAGIINNVLDEVQKGKALSDAFRIHSDFLPVILISMVEVGEVSGTLDVVLGKLSVHFEKDNKTRQKIKSAMTYPIAIGLIALAMIIFMLSFVVPKFMAMFTMEGAVLPFPTRILLGISHAFTNVWFLSAGTAMALILGFLFSKFRNTPKGKVIITKVIFRIPKVGTNYKKILASRFARALSLLIETGVPLIRALDVVERVVDNQVVSIGLAKVRDEIKRGSNLAAPLENLGIFPAMVTQMISIGEESGSLDAVVGKVADFYDEELDTSISQMISLLEPVMILGLALIVGFIVVSMILPIFGMYKNLSYMGHR